MKKSLYLAVQLKRKVWFVKERTLQELYNIIFYTVKGSYKLNQAGYAETESN